ncbi:MAG: 3'(2'),5'-bisphosphate nucleotidase CysQ [Wenzhouxiangellaceae bacterium]
MTTRDESRWLAPLIGIAREAAARILEVYQRDDFEVEHKGDSSPLTEADLASHELIIRGLRELTPDIPVLSEESSRLDVAERASWTELWVVDPLDGTREFVSRNGEFTINIALVRNQRPVLGLIAVPVSGEIYTGIVGQGALRWSQTGQADTIRTRRPAARPPVVLGSRSHRNPRSDEYFSSLGPHRLISRGSALKFCAVAAGEADFYPRLGPTSEWDTAAGDAIVTAAGGRVCLPDGRPLRYNARDSLLNGDFVVVGDPEFAWPPLPPQAG